MKNEASPFAAIRSNIPGIEWPPISQGPAAALAAALRQLDDTQWLSPAALAERQFRQLGHVVRHCDRYSSHFHARLAGEGLKPDDLLSPEGLRRLPPLKRRELQTAAGIFCTAVPDGHAPLSEARTSGSTGEPLKVMRTRVNSFDWFAYTLRDHFWHKRDLRKRCCVTRADIPAPKRFPDWGQPVNFLFESGPMLLIPIEIGVARQAELIREFAPDGLLIYPSNLAGVLQECEKRGIAFPGLSHIRTISETLPPALRDETRRVLGTEIQDCYSSREIGNIAFQCPEAPHYHVVESVIVEILDDRGAPCPEGQAGRVVVTDLHNFATPLIRYEIGDYAEAGPPCPCGRGLPVLRRILGRERNLVRMPDGRRHWPVFGINKFRDIAPVLQFQCVQSAPEEIEARLVVSRPLTAAEEAALTACVGEALGYAFALRFTYFERELARGTNGKFEEFLCLLP